MTAVARLQPVHATAERTEVVMSRLMMCRGIDAAPAGDVSAHRTGIEVRQRPKEVGDSERSALRVRRQSLRGGKDLGVNWSHLSIIHVYIRQSPATGRGDGPALSTGPCAGRAWRCRPGGKTAVEADLQVGLR